MRRSWPLLTVTTPLSHRSETSAVDFPKNNAARRTRHPLPVREKRRDFWFCFLCLFHGTFSYITLSHPCSARAFFWGVFFFFPTRPSPPCVTLIAVNMTMGRDTKWLTLEVCREFQRGTCSRSDAECKFAHPSRSCHVENGRVIACFDSLKVTSQMHFCASLHVLLEGCC